MPNTLRWRLGVTCLFILLHLGRVNVQLHIQIAKWRVTVSDRGWVVTIHNTQIVNISPIAMAFMTIAGLFACFKSLYHFYYYYHQHSFKLAFSINLHLQHQHTLLAFPCASELVMHTLWIFLLPELVMCSKLLTRLQWLQCYQLPFFVHQTSGL